MLELGEHRQHVEHRPALHGGSVDALLDDVQPDAALEQVRAEGSPGGALSGRAGRADSRRELPILPTCGFVITSASADRWSFLDT
ncbi:hypothetical protein [Streptomyces californicus]|uniref:hypothetical protein n=1 Tax=Streptomyces californicus TaxID=67351 RepID=UPI0035DD5EAA